MKTITILQTLIFVIIMTQNTMAVNNPKQAPVCEIGEILVEVEPCDELGYFEVILTFEYANVSDSGFTVQGNGVNYGNFQYQDLPVTIGPLEGDGVTEYEFVVTDLVFPDCSNWTAIDPVDCGTGDCQIWDLVVDDHPCVGEMFNVYLNFEYENVSAEGFSVFVNDDLFENYLYEDLPLESIGPFLGDGTTFYEFKEPEVYPNPFRDILYLNHLPAGVYFIRMQAGSQVVMRKLIKIE
ncbi:MAG: T9SS type A sorting domain-containing protein [Bacteroidota bacterium]|nr:T9SS type A sorting domain-containing protein [Bacteroidota bacterium]